MLWKTLKVLAINFGIWISLSAGFSYWLMWDQARHPVEPRPDGTLPGDSLGIPMAGFAFMLLIVLLVLNAVYFAIKHIRVKKQKTKSA